jgi:hypothetical protein
MLSLNRLWFVVGVVGFSSACSPAESSGSDELQGGGISQSQQKTLDCNDLRREVSRAHLTVLGLESGTNHKPAAPICTFELKKLGKMGKACDEEQTSTNGGPVSAEILVKVWKFVDVYQKVEQKGCVLDAKFQVSAKAYRPGLVKAGMLSALFCAANGKRFEVGDSHRTGDYNLKCSASGQWEDTESEAPSQL